MSLTALTVPRPCRVGTLKLTLLLRLLLEIMTDPVNLYRETRALTAVFRGTVVTQLMSLGRLRGT